MNPSSQQIAEVLARKCAIEQHKMNCNLEPHELYECKRFIKERSDLILQAIPLVELLEYVSELKYQVAQYNRGHRSTSLELLATKLKQQGIIE